MHEALAPVTRRTALLGTLGIGAVAALAGCSATSAPAGAVSVGSYESDAIPRTSMRTMMDNFPGGTVDINVLDHETFKSSINNYLQGNPNDVFTWFAGYRARYFAERGLVANLDDVWANLDGMPASMRASSAGKDGGMIFLPSTWYPWAVFYKPSLWAKQGWTPPTTLDEWVSLNEQIKVAGITPIGMADLEGWEAMGTFDMLNLRVNGYDYHVSLMAGEEAWDGDKARAVFRAWDELMPFQQADPLGRAWQEAAQGLLQEKTAMYTMGMFIDQQWQTSQTPDDLDFFMFPEFDKAIGADIVEAPVDGFMMAARPKNPDMARQLMTYLGSPGAINILLAGDPSKIGANERSNQSAYSRLQRKAVEEIGKAKNLTHFLDRDTRPDFATTVLNPAFQAYLRTPGDIDSILRSVQRQKRSIFGF
ncbi:ABC transporter substrate-binding protein [Propionibacteriaceae bacterium G57]|uniref:ABC transporter substrate-binding protein n=1 Tax=Aestuariimicrobium sp. G57 TaxID=3418485 RepID=UPI003DA74AFC